MQENLKSRTITIDKDFIELMGSNEDKQFRFNDGSKIFGINIFA